MAREDAIVLFLLGLWGWSLWLAAQKYMHIAWALFGATTALLITGRVMEWLLTASPVAASAAPAELPELEVFEEEQEEETPESGPSPSSQEEDAWSWRPGPRKRSASLGAAV